MKNSNYIILLITLVGILHISTAQCMNPQITNTTNTPEQASPKGHLKRSRLHAFYNDDNYPDTDAPLTYADCDFTDAEAYELGELLSPNYKIQKTLSPSKSLSSWSLFAHMPEFNMTHPAQQTPLMAHVDHGDLISTDESVPQRSPKNLSPREKLASPPKSPPKRLVPLKRIVSQTDQQNSPNNVEIMQHPAQEPAPLESVYFSPEIRPVLLNLISQSTQGFVGAVYSFDDVEIAQELAKKTQSHPDFKSIVFLSNGEKVKNGPKAHVQQILSNAAVPLLFHQQVNPASTDPHNSHKFFEEMHNKLCLIWDINGRPLLFTGSYNFTRFAHQKSHENAYITQDPHCILQYLNALEYLYSHREPRNLSDNHLSNLVSDLRQKLYELIKLNPTQSITAYFSPHIPTSPSTSIMTFLETMFSQEKKGVVAAQYHFTHFDIARWWTKSKQAMENNNQKTFDGYLIVDKEYDKQFCSGLHHLVTHNIPVFAHKGPKKMHDKFLIFLQNKNDQAVVVGGSANLTANSLYYDFNNLFATCNKNVIMNFLQEANILKKNSKILTAATARSTQNFSRYRASFNRIPKTLIDNVTAKNGGALCRENYTLYNEPADLEHKSFLNLNEKTS